MFSVKRVYINAELGFKSKAHTFLHVYIPHQLGSFVCFTASNDQIREPFFSCVDNTSFMRVRVFILTFGIANSPGLAIMKPCGNLQIGCMTASPEVCFCSTQSCRKQKEKAAVQPHIDPEGRSKVDDGARLSK